MYCEKCGTQIDENANFCPNCGYNLAETKEPVSEAAATPNVAKRKANACSILSIVFASVSIILAFTSIVFVSIGIIGISPLFDIPMLLCILFVFVAIILAIIGFVTGKNKGEKSKKADIIVLVISIIILILRMIPAIIGSPIGPSTNNDSDNQNNSTVCSHSYYLKSTEATCLSGGYATYQCSLCDATKSEYESSLGHTTSEGTCSRCGESFGTWEKAFYVDEFNNPTNQAYLRTSDVLYGTFSNSATTDSTLYAKILIDAEDVAIKLWEYGSNEVNAYTSTDYEITILDDSGTKHYTSGTMYKNGERIYLSDWTLVNLLQNNTQLKIYIRENSKYGVNSTYLFSVKNGNFNSVYYDFYYDYMN